jgi:hypothetical protein
MFGGDIMSDNLSSIYSSYINSIGSSYKSSAERTGNNSKDIGSTLFAAQLENAKKIDTYLDEIKNYVPNTIVTVKSMNAGDVQKYYQEWKQQPIDYSGLKPNITVSPKVLAKMEKDPKYAEQMLQKIKRAAIPEGFGDATIYEYKVIVRDDGEIETLACADFMNGKNNKTENKDEEDDNKKKYEKKKVEVTYFYRRLFDQWESQTLLEEVTKITQFIQPQYLFHTRVVKK